MTETTAPFTKGASHTTGTVHYARIVKHADRTATIPMLSQRCGMSRRAIAYLREVPAETAVTCKRCLAGGEAIAEAAYLAAKAERTARMPIGPRSEVTDASGLFHGVTAVYWTRQINGVPYAFRRIAMPDGEIRFSVQRYNGYGDRAGDASPAARASAMRFACAWSPAHFLRARPETQPGDGTSDGDRVNRPENPNGPRPGDGRPGKASAETQEKSSTSLADQADSLAGFLAERYPDDAELADQAARVAEACGAPARKSTARLAAGDRVHARIVGTGKVRGLVPAGADAPAVTITSAKRQPSTGGRAVYIVKIRGAQTTRTGSQMWTMATASVAPSVVAAAASTPRKVVTVPVEPSPAATDALTAASEAVRIAGVIRTMSRVMFETLIGCATLGTAGRWPTSGSIVALIDRQLISTRDPAHPDGASHRVLADGWAVLSSPALPASWSAMLGGGRVVEVAHHIHDELWTRASVGAEADLAADAGECPHCGMDFVETETDGDVRRDHVRNCIRNPRGTGQWRLHPLTRRIAVEAGLDPDLMTADEFATAVKTAHNQTPAGAPPAAEQEGRTVADKRDPEKHKGAETKADRSKNKGGDAGKVTRKTERRDAGTEPNDPTDDERHGGGYTRKGR